LDPAERLSLRGELEDFLPEKNAPPETVADDRDPADSVEEAIQEGVATVVVGIPMVIVASVVTGLG